MPRQFPGSDVPANEPQTWLRRTLDRLNDFAFGKYPLTLKSDSQTARIIYTATRDYPDAVLQVQVAVYASGRQGWRTVMAVDGAGNVTFRGSVGGSALGWRPTTPYVADVRACPLRANGHWYKVTVAGTSGTAEPAWPTSAGGTVVDGGVTWTEDGAPPELDLNLLGLESQE